MKRLCLLALVAATISASSGCCLFDRLFCARRCYPMPGPGSCTGCCNDGCASGGCGGGCTSGGCSSGCCTSGGCSTGGCMTGGCGCASNGGYDASLASGGPEGGFGPGCGAAAPCWQTAKRGPPPIAAEQYQGPPTGQVSYPYYTTRGPRDFLNPNPPSIGP